MAQYASIASLTFALALAGAWPCSLVAQPVEIEQSMGNTILVRIGEKVFAATLGDNATATAFKGGPETADKIPTFLSIGSGPEIGTATALPSARAWRHVGTWRRHDIVDGGMFAVGPSPEWLSLRLAPPATTASSTRSVKAVTLDTMSSELRV
jgi:hypothetical protein